MADHPTINVALYAQTDVGMVRSGNEDNFLILDLSTGTSWSAGDEEPNELLTFQQGYYGTLLAVSDGMGGALAGEVASRLAVETVRDRMLQLQAHPHYGKLPFHERLRLAVEEANLLIHADGLANPAHKGLGATFTGVGTYANKAYFAQVGDSRAYLIRQGRIERITKDQSLVQQLIDAGQITEEEAETHSYRNVILQALGAHINVNVEVNTLEVCHLDTLVLCSDGLSGKMHAEEILAVVHEADDFKTACQNLIALANQRGGEDNITVIIVQFSGSGVAQPDGDAIEPQGIARSPDTPTELNWSLGAATDQLTDPVPDPLAVTDPTGEVATSPAHLSAPAAPVVSPATEPLTSAPAPPPSTTSPLRQRTASLNRTNDLADRRGPITSVFEIPVFDEEAPAASAGAQPDDRAPSNGAAHAAAAPAAKSKGQPTQTSSSLLPVILTIIALAGIGGVAFWYYSQQARQRDAVQAAQLAQQQENESQKQLQLTRLRDQVTQLNKKLFAATKIGSEKREKMEKKLARAARQLDEISQLSNAQLQEIERRCEEIGKDLKEIEEDLNNLQGLLPNQNPSRNPIKL
jgi:protein phosphatase